MLRSQLIFLVYISYQLIEIGLSVFFFKLRCLTVFLTLNLFSLQSKLCLIFTLKSRRDLIEKGDAATFKKLLEH